MISAPTTPMANDNLLIFADSAHCADLRYAVGVAVTEPFVYLRVKGRAYALLGDSDLERARQQARNCRVLSLARYQGRAAVSEGGRTALAEVIRRLAVEKQVRRLWVPAGFPLGLARELRRLKVRVKPRRDELFFPERELKSAAEIEMIRAALVMAEVGMAEAVQALKNSKPDPRGRLLYRGAPLTAERLRAIIHVAVLQAGGHACEASVAGGRQACCPQEPGSGPLAARQPIVIRIAPRSDKTGYHGDLTRTVVRGQASEGMRRLNAAVEQAQDTAVGLSREGVKAAAIHRAVQAQFSQAGYRTLRGPGGPRGCLHGTGHGIGLERDEPPWITATSPAVLRSGHVLAIGPGLYYPGLGSVCIKDLVVVTRNGARNLTRFEKVLEV